MWAEEVLPAIFVRRCIPLIYSLTLFECEKGGGEAGGASSFLENLRHPFHFQGAGDEGKKGGGRPLLSCQDLSHNPGLT